MKQKTAVSIVATMNGRRTVQTGNSGMSGEDVGVGVGVASGVGVGEGGVPERIGSSACTRSAYRAIFWSEATSL